HPPLQHPPPAAPQPWLQPSHEGALAAVDLEREQRPGAGGSGSRLGVDLGNAQLLQQHLVCAAAELPLDPSQGGGDAALFGTQLQGVCAGLVAARLVGQHPQQTWPDAPLYYTGPRTVPAADVSLRCIAEEHIDIVLEGGGQVLERVELNAAFYQVYDGAIYLFQGRPYLCKTLDLAARVAVVRPVDVKYYTKAVPGTRGGGGTALGGQGLEPGAAAAAAGPAAGSGGGQALVPAAGASGPGASQARPPLQASCETALITVRYLGFSRVWQLLSLPPGSDGAACQQGTGQVFDRVDLWLPDVRYETQAAYMRLPPSARRVCRECGLGFRDGVHGAAHAVLNVLPLFVICNAKDVGTECDNPYDTRYRPERLLIFDKLPGGIGIALQVRNSGKYTWDLCRVHSTLPLLRRRTTLACGVLAGSAVVSETSATRVGPSARLPLYV
ncbi:hypothetical protein V8C86DRAFT_2443312, partial [Haematococcus lacustris]